MTPTDRQVAELHERMVRIEALVRQLQGPRPVVSTEYSFATATSEPPNAGQIRLNGSYETATKMWVSYAATSGADDYQALSGLRVGSGLFLQDFNDHRAYVRYEMTGKAIDKGSYVELPIKWIASGQPLGVTKILLVIAGARGG